MDTPFIQEFHETFPIHDGDVSNDVSSLMIDSAGTLWAETAAGVYKLSREEGTWSKESKGPEFETDAKRRSASEYTPAPGIPFTEINCVAEGPHGFLWVGTPSGLCRYDGKTWSLRHSRRWLLSDDVRDTVFDAEGTAWIATAGGVSAIRRKSMTLAEKEAYFRDILMARHIRDPWLVGRCRLKVQGDVSSWEPEDDDNDGQYTAMVLMQESCRYAATGLEEARENAKNAFDALVFLQTVTDTDGFVARSVVPSSWEKMHDPNVTYTDEEWAKHQGRDSRNKRVEDHWLPSKDGKWLWKRDTSSDEITGHFCGYLFYYRLLADEEEKGRVRRHVRKIMDYIVDNGFNLIDVDGTYTRWGVWAPEQLNDDPRWLPERYANSLEILSYLAVTFDMTGDDKYRSAAHHLLYDHHYLENITKRPPHTALTYSNIDNELLALTFPGLIWCEKDQELLDIYKDCLDHWYDLVKMERSPYFNFTYGLLTGEDPHLKDSIEYLRDAPLDLVDWRVDNSKREDLDLKLSPAIHPLQTHPLPPPSERAVVRWDKTPWPALQGGSGESEWCPHYWLLPYWMGRYGRFIAEPKTSDEGTISLFNGNSLKGFYTFIKDRGRNTDPNAVFTVQDGLLRISGEEWGCITTEAEYEDYHLVAEYKWGEATHSPREDRARDNGILLHSVGEDGAFGGSWMHSIECQLIEGGTGDFIVVGDGTDSFSITCPVDDEKQGSCFVFRPDGTPVTVHSGRVNWFGRDPDWKDVKGFRGAKDVEHAVGKWNRLECICHGDTITVVLNGVVVNQCAQVSPSKGRIQVQSEGAEIFYRRLELSLLE